MKLITIKTFDDGISAHILKNKLESEGINCFVFDENIVTVNALFSNAVGGVKLKIEEQDKEKALSIIQEIENKPLTDQNDVEIRCPECHSTSLYSNFKSMKDGKGILSAIVSFVFFVFPIYYKSVYKCKNCGAEFR